MMSEPTCRQCVADCLSGVETYLPCTVGQGCRLFERCRNLPAGHYVQGCRPGTVLKGCRLFKQCINLPAGHCVAGVQAD